MHDETGATRDEVKVEKKALAVRAYPPAQEDLSWIDGKLLWGAGEYKAYASLREMERCYRDVEHLREMAFGTSLRKNVGSRLRELWLVRRIQRWAVRHPGLAGLLAVFWMVVLTILFVFILTRYVHG